MQEAKCAILDFSQRPSDPPNMVKILDILTQHWLPAVLFILTTITVLSLIPLTELPKVPGGDKSHHILAYALLIFPLGLRKPKNWLWIALFFLCWSGAIELLQPLVNRYADWLDLLANGLGLLCGLLAAHFFRRHRASLL